MTDFLREWAKHYPIRFIIALTLCAFFGYLILALVSPNSWFGQSWETVSKIFNELSRHPKWDEKLDHRSRLAWAILLNVLILLGVIGDRLSEFNSSFEGFLVDKYEERRGRIGIIGKFKFSKNGKEFTEDVELKQYEVAKIGDYVKKEPKAFGYQVISASDSTDNT